MAKTGTTAFTFPVGKGGQWARIGIGIPTASETFTAEYFNTGYGTYTVTQTPNIIDHVSKLEYWTLGRAGAANATVQLFWENASNSGITNCSDLGIAHWNGTAWENNNDAVTVASAGCPNPTSQSGNIVTNAVVSSFSPFTFASKGGIDPLPVELLSFDAKPNGNVADVTWTTASEFNSDYFVVQRSKDGTMFNDVTQMKGAGNSSTVKKYSSVDYDSYNNVSYYRLKQVDNNGRFTYSGLVPVKFHNEDMISVYPNPSIRGEPLTVSISGQIGKEVLVVVRDFQGREFYSKVIVISSDREVIAIDPSGKLASGVYFIVATSDNKIYEKKIVVK
jgi:hypothetical protein